MKFKNILVTGGAGFIGSFLVDKLIKSGYKVRVLDNLEEQVHHGGKPKYLNPQAEFIKGDVRNYKTFEKILEGVEVVFHLAARVGVAQSNYEIKDYVDTNIGGMANLLDIVVTKKTKVKKILMLASMTSYGEGDYKCSSCGIVKPSLRSGKQMAKKKWEPFCPHCQKPIIPIPTQENSALLGNSVYALTKETQEELLFHTGKIFNLPVVSLRCFNAYGPRQSLSNPYTGVTAIFISRLKNNQRPVVYEDGLQTRDFISIHDVVDALVGSMVNKRANFGIMNIGSGKQTTIKDMAIVLAKLLDKNIKPKINGEFRKGDIRHCYADISKAKKLIGWQPKTSLEEGLEELINWSQKENPVDLFEAAEKQLRSKKLL